MTKIFRYHGGEISLSVDTGTILKHSLTQHGSVLTLHSVTRSASGVYICTARNGVGQPATSQVNFNRKFRIWTERYLF